MKDIISKIETLKEDHPGIVLTNDIILEYIFDNIDSLLKEIKENL